MRVAGIHAFVPSSYVFQGTLIEQLELELVVKYGILVSKVMTYCATAPVSGYVSTFSNTFT